MRTFKYIINSENSNKSIEYYLSKYHGYSKRCIRALKKNNQSVLLNNNHAKMIDILLAGDELKISLFQNNTIVPNSQIYVPIIYEDNDIIIYNKPFNIPVHPSLNHFSDTLANVFSHHILSSQQSSTFHPINRLDKDTTGLCLVCKNSFCASKFKNALKKEYTAIVSPPLTKKSGTISAPIQRVDNTIIKRMVGSKGKFAVTNFKVIYETEKYSLVKIHLETGRTHQIRVHFSYISHPLAGDYLYGGDISDINRQALSCTKLSFFHPIKQIYMSFCINIHGDMSIILNNN